jgi:hypothetical protein
MVILAFIPVFGTLSNMVVVPNPLPNYKKNANVRISI